MAGLELTLNFPESFHIKTFNLKPKKKLSPLANSILSSIKFKHFYYVRDDIAYLLNSNPLERDFLLQAFYSIILSLQNNSSVNFFDMWIYEIYITTVPVNNRFLNEESQSLESDKYITIKLAYETSVS
jgi:hypothetical protein